MTEEQLKYKIEQLSHNERKLLALKAKDFIVKEANRSKLSKQKKIVAYLETENPLDLEGLKAHLKNRLPDYMIPSAFLEIEKTPLLPNGKINKKELLKLKHDTYSEETIEGGIVKPATATEEKLVKIWEEVLDFSPISTHDNFFEIGGDSILSIQIISKARKAGIDLKANQIFENQTIAELSLFSKENNLEIVSESIITGEVPLTPIQYWFFDTHKAAPHFWNQIAEVKNIPDTINSNDIENLASKLIYQHDALRSSFVKNNDTWKAIILNPESTKSFNEIDIKSQESKDIQDAEIEKNIETIQQSFNLSEGNLFKIIYFNCGKTQKNRMFIIAHHLVIDFVSWNIIFSDVQSALKQMLNNQSITFGKKTNSLKKWGSYLQSLIDSRKVINELPFWASQKNDSKQFPVDFKSNVNVYNESSIHNHTSIIDAKSTTTLLLEANKLYNTKPEDLLITVLLKTICEWADIEHFCLGLERQGRAIDDGSIDISNTVGWFTAYFPVMLSNANTSDFGEKIKSVKEQLHAIPNNGIGYGILKYLMSKSDEKITLNIRPKVIFNYLGNINDSFDDSKIDFQFLSHGARSPFSERTYQIEINSIAKNGKLHINWSYVKDLYEQANFLKLVNAYEANLKALIAYCNQKENGSYTPSDFPESGLNQEDLDNLMDLL